LNTNVVQGYILAGQDELDEWPDFKQWTNDLRASTDWRLSIIPQTGHEIGAPRYQEAVINLAKQLGNEF